METSTVQAKSDDFVYDPFAIDVMRDPYPYYKVLRERFPIYRMEKYDAWAISGYADIHALLTGHETPLETLEASVVNPWAMLKHNRGVVPLPQLDPLGGFPDLINPYHAQIRQTSLRPLRPNAVMRLEEFVRKRTRARLEELIDWKRFNATTDFGGWVAAGTACRFSGLPLSYAPRLLSTSNKLTRRDPEKGGFLNDGREEAAELHRMLMELVISRRREGADGSNPTVDGLINLNFMGRRLTDSEIAVQVNNLIVGASETLPKVIGAGLHELWRHPAQRAEVAADPAGNAAAAFEEMLRYGAPAQWFVRTVTAPFDFQGHRFTPGQRLFLLMASANRDERMFESADEFRWNRRIEDHLAFGRGMHYCPGDHVARLEGRIMIEEFLRRLPNYEIDEANARRVVSDFQLGWMEVPVILR